MTKAQALQWLMDSEQINLREITQQSIPSGKTGLQCYTEVEMKSRMVAELTSTPMPMVLGTYKVRTAFLRETILSPWRCQRRIILFQPKDRTEWMHFTDVDTGNINLT